MKSKALVDEQAKHNQKIQLISFDNSLESKSILDSECAFLDNENNGNKDGEENESENDSLYIDNNQFQKFLVDQLFKNIT